MTFTITGKTEKAAFLGVSTSQVTPAMSSQLKLARGIRAALDKTARAGD